MPSRKRSVKNEFALWVKAMSTATQPQAMVSGAIQRRAPIFSIIMLLGTSNST